MRLAPPLRPLPQEALSFPDFVELNVALSEEDLLVVKDPLAYRTGAPEIERWAVANERQDLAYTFTLRAAYNTTIPIHRYLPFELLSGILCLAGRAWHSMKALRLLHVCRLWRTILVKTTEFWADMLAVPDVYRRMELVKVLLDRSGSHQFQLAPPYPRRELICGEMMQPHLHRVSRLPVPTDLTASELYSLLTDKRLSNLYTLDVSRASKVSIEGAQSLLRAEHRDEAVLFPRLQELTASSILVPYLVAQSVEKLSILSPPNGQLLPEDVLGRALILCSRRLKWLSIQPDVLPPEWHASNEVGPAHFPSLGYLRLQASSPDSIKSFLTSVRFPYSTARIFIGSALESGPWTVREKFRHLLPDGLVDAVVDAADRLHISYRSASEYLIQTYIGDRELLTVRQTEPDDLTTDVLTIVPGLQSIRTLRFYMTYLPESYRDLLQILAAFPQITHLQLGPMHASKESIGLWKNALPALAAVPPSSDRLVCPDLQELTIFKERLDSTDLEKGEREPLEAIASVLEDRQRQLGHPLLSFVISFMPRQLPYRTESYEVDKAVDLYTARLAHCAERISTSAFQRS